MNKQELTQLDIHLLLKIEETEIEIDFPRIETLTEDNATRLQDGISLDQSRLDLSIIGILGEVEATTDFSVETWTSGHVSWALTISLVTLI